MMCDGTCTVISEALQQTGNSFFRWIATVFQKQTGEIQGGFSTGFAHKIWRKVISARHS